MNADPDPDLSATLEALHNDAFGWARHCCDGDVSRAEDVLQNSYLKVVQGRAVPSGRSTVKTWWFGVIRFTAREEARRARFREALNLRLWHGVPPPSPSSPERLAEVAEDTARLRAALLALPRRQAEVLHLMFYQDLSLSAAATVLGISVGSARQHYERGKARLRSLLTHHDCSRPQPGPGQGPA